jgi:hypothetical protein
LYRDVKHAKKYPNNKTPGAKDTEAGVLPWGKLDFTHMPGGPKLKLLLVLVDMFTGWVEAFSCSKEPVGRWAEF